MTPTPRELAALARDRSDLPRRMLDLPIDAAGRPTPFFAHITEDGEPDHRVIGAGKLNAAISNRWCWICGQPLGGRLSFAIGPMCTVNRVSAEPPQHIDCAVWSATHCPFLVNPNKGRREVNIPENTKMSDFGLARNPGVTAVWSTKKFSMFRAPDTWLFRLGEPTSVLWFRYGQPATRADVEEAFVNGCPALREIAKEDGKAAERELAWLEKQAEEWWPAEVAS